MLQATDERNRDRIKSALAVAAFHVLLGYALIVGFGYHAIGAVPENLKVFDVLPEPPPPPPPPPEPLKVQERKTKPKAVRPEGAASPKNLKDTPSPIVAPPPPIPLPPPPILAAREAGQGNAASQGASDVPGPGTGSGGQGNGTGSGDSGDGDGGGGGGGPSEWIEGRIKNSDYPRNAVEAGVGGTVFLRFVVGVKGRVTSCAVTRSSGDAVLDETTCRLIQKRFRYRPAYDAAGRAVPDVITGKHQWVVQKRELPPIEEEDPDDGRDAEPRSR